MLCFVVSLFLVLLGFGHLSTKLGTLNLDANAPDDSDLSESTSGGIRNSDFESSRYLGSIQMEF